MEYIFSKSNSLVIKLTLLYFIIGILLIILTLIDEKFHFSCSYLTSCNGLLPLGIPFLITLIYAMPSLAYLMNLSPNFTNESSLQFFGNTTIAILLNAILLFIVLTALHFVMKKILRKKDNV
jgi:hypothetical protein